MQRLNSVAIATLGLLLPFAALGNSSSMSDATVKHYGRALALWMDVREGCGDGYAFQGAESLVQQKLQAYQAAAGRLRGYASSPLTGLSPGFVSRGNSATSQLVPGTRNSVTLTVQAQAAVGSLQAMAGELTARIAAVGAANAGPYTIALGAVHRALGAARAASRAISCRRAEDEIRFVVARTVNAVPGEDAEVDLPNTIEDRPLVVRGESCTSLEEVATNLSAIIQDSNEALLHERAYFERAVASQMVVEYLRRHGGREGRLDARRDSRLRDMTNDLVSRYIRQEERVAARLAAAE